MRVYIFNDLNINYLEKCLDLEHAFSGEKLIHSDIIYHENGKPFFKDKSIHFNYSNTDLIWIGAFRDSYELGIDIEPLSIANICTKKIAYRFFNTLEITFFEKNPQLFSSIWTLKESYVKCTSRGINHDFSNFSVVNPRGYVKKINNYYFYRVTFQNHIISICTLNPEDKFEFFIISSMTAHLAISDITPNSPNLAVEVSLFYDTYEE